MPAAEEGNESSLTVMVSELEALHARDTSIQTATFALASVGASVVALLALQFPKPCPDDSFDTTCLAKGDTALYYFAPLPSTLVIMFLAFLAIYGALIGQYIHSLEQHLSKEYGTTTSPDTAGFRSDGLKIPSFSRIAGSLLRGRPYLHLFTNVMFVLSAVVVLMAAIVPLRQAELSTIIGVAAIYVPINAVTAYAYARFTWGGRRELERAQRHRERVEGERAAGSDQRLAADRRSYIWKLLVPRTVDVLPKSVLFPLGFVVGAGLAQRWSRDVVLDGLIAWALLEWGAYHGRYLINDIRDWVLDKAHPARAERNRTSFELTRTRLVGMLFMVLARWALWVLGSLVLLHGSVRVISLVGGAVVIVLGLLYEHLREAVRRLSTVGALDRKSRRVALRVIAAVLPGPVIRFVMGVLVASEGSQLRLGWLLLAALAVLLMQMSTALVWWACEATLFVDKFPHATHYTEGLVSRAHLALMLAHAGAIDKTTPKRSASPDARLGSSANRAVVALARYRRSLLDLKVWDVASYLAVFGAIALAPIIGGAQLDGHSWLIVLALALVGGLAPVFIKLRQLRSVRCGAEYMTTWEFRMAVTVQLAATVIVAVVVYAYAGWASAGLAVAFPAFVIGQLYLGLAANYYGSITMSKEWAKKLRRFGKGLCEGVLDLLIGSRARQMVVESSIDPRS